MDTETYDANKVLTFENGAKLLLDDHRGIYIPRDFISQFDPKEWGITAENVAILENPEHEWYWEAWDEVLTHASITLSDGRTFTLWQDGALFAVDSRVCWDCSAQATPCSDHGTECHV